MEVKQSSDVVIVAPAEHEDGHDQRDAAQHYAVSCWMWKDGHVCTYLTRLDMQQFKVITTRMACYHVAGASEREALDVIVTTALDRRQDLDAGVDPSP